MFAESLELNPDDVLSKNALTNPRRTIVDPESRKIEVLNEALEEYLKIE